MDISPQELLSDHESPERKQHINELKTQIKSSLELNGGNKWLDVLLETEDLLLHTIAETTYEISQYLKLPNVNFGIIKLKEREDKKGYYKYRNLEDQFVDAQLHVEPKNGSTDFNLLYNAKFLKWVAQDLIDPDLCMHAQNALRWMTAHELYHIKQAIKWPHLLAATASRIDGSQDEEEFYKRWYQERTEYSAQLFAFSYIQNKLNLDRDLGDMVTRTAAVSEAKDQFDQYKANKQKYAGTGWKKAA